ncbi:hypothetical protein PIB30_042164 [Stylosanthes scabra]|uniref:WHIM2 domain-containing protein n=1 Tax=Stylosanthes scabra TaxID=79078 RepID=A0ABU6RFR0_9FABA|nr:hypothetical protein [Stylosanthes scabra]
MNEASRSKSAAECVGFTRGGSVVIFSSWDAAYSVTLQMRAAPSTITHPPSFLDVPLKKQVLMALIGAFNLATKRVDRVSDLLQELRTRYEEIASKFSRSEKANEHAFSFKVGGCTTIESQSVEIHLKSLKVLTVEGKSLKLTILGYWITIMATPKCFKYKVGGWIFVEHSDLKEWGYYNTNEELDVLMDLMNCKSECERALQAREHGC